MGKQRQFFPLITFHYEIIANSFSILTINHNFKIGLVIRTGNNCGIDLQAVVYSEAKRYMYV